VRKAETLSACPFITIGPQRGRKSMSKLTFSHHLQSEYTCGKDLNLLPFELFNHVKAGRLHPLDKDTGRPIPRPDVSKIKKHLEEIEQEIKVLPLAYGKLQTGKVYPFTHKQPQPVKVIFKGSPDQVEKQLDEWDKKSQQEKEEEMWKKQLDERAEKLQEEQGSLNEKLKATTAINDWTTYDPPKEPKHLITHLPIDLMKAFDILQNARFHNDEIRILNIETPLDSSEEPDNVPPKAPAPVEESAPAPVNEVVFSYMSPTEVMVKCGNKRAASYDQISLGFKKVKNPKAWNAFLEILKSGNPSFSFGKSRTKYNDNTRKMFESINDKLVVFLNTKMKMHIPQDFKLYEKDKTAGTGIYKFNFRIGKYNTNSIGAEDLTDDKLMADIEKCHNEQNKLIHRGDKDAESQSEAIRERLIPLLTEARARNLITDKQMQTYLNPPEDD